MQPFITPGLMIIKERYSKQIRESVLLWLANMPVKQLPRYICSNIYQENTDNLPGKALGEIDLMSRMTDDETLDSVRIRRVCPS